MSIFVCGVDQKRGRETGLLTVAFITSPKLLVVKCSSHRYAFPRRSVGTRKQFGTFMTTLIFFQTAEHSYGMVPDKEDRKRTDEASHCHNRHQPVKNIHTIIIRDITACSRS